MSSPQRRTTPRRPATPAGTSKRRSPAPRPTRAIAPVVGRIERQGAVAVAVEAVLLGLGALALLVAWMTGGVANAGMAAYLGSASLVGSAGLVWVSRALWRGSRWPRGASTAWQMFQVAVAFGLTEPRTWPWMVPSAVRIGAVVFLLGLVVVALAGVVSAAIRTQRETRP